MASEGKSETYTIPDDYVSLSEIATNVPLENQESENVYNHNPPARFDYRTQENCHGVRRWSSDKYDVPESFKNLDELAAPSPVDNPYERRESRHEYLEELRSEEQTYHENAERELDDNPSRGESDHPGAAHESETNTSTTLKPRASTLATELYTVSYLILFSILGTLARLGLQALTTYPGSPTTSGVLWANVGGSMIIGFLSEDRKLFKGGDNKTIEGGEKDDSDGSQDIAGGTFETDPHGCEDVENVLTETQEAHITMKKSIPLYIGLTTGFCGSFTSFSSFIREIFLELANQSLATQPNTSATGSAAPRSGGFSFMAMLAIIILTVCLCLSALKFGAHVAIGLESIIPPLPACFTCKTIDRFVVLLSWTSWLGSVLMTIWPPDRPFGPAAQLNTSWAQETWRGQVLFALVFAPLGCLLRFYASIHLNGIFASFPLGTFVSNVAGTVILGICWDLQRVPLCAAGACVGGGRIGCQVLEGVQDGFCGCLTTISTWVLELVGLRRIHAYIYGGISISVGLAFLVVIMGSLVWSRVVLPTACSA